MRFVFLASDWPVLSVWLLGLPCWVSHRHVGRVWCCELHGVRGWSLQRRSHSGMCGLRAWIDDECTQWWRSHYMHGVCSGAVQCSVDDSVPCVSCWVPDRHAGGCEWDVMHCVCGWAVECSVYGRMC